MKEAKPMIIGSSGPHGVGKSTLAAAMAVKMKNDLIFDAKKQFMPSIN